MLFAIAITRWATENAVEYCSALTLMHDGAPAAATQLGWTCAFGWPDLLEDHSTVLRASKFDQNNSWQI